MDHKKAQTNPWPGFVDVLSSTLLVFVFLVIVQLLVIAGVSMKVSQTISQKISEQMLTDVEKFKEEATQVDSVKAEDRLKKDKIITAEADLKITYQDLSTLLSTNESSRVDRWVNKNKHRLSSTRIKISAFLGRPDLSMSTSYFVSYSRAMVLRSQLVALGLPAKNITLRIYNASDHTKNEVVVHLLE